MKKQEKVQVVETIQEEQPLVEEVSNEQVVDQPQEKPKSKHQLRKEKRREKRLARIKARLFKPNDIKYQGPLSYRYLRIFAWLAVIIGQMAFLASLATKMMGWNILKPELQAVFSSLSSLSTPLFIVASFGLVLNHKRTFKSILFLYGGAFLAVGLGIDLLYLRYISGLFVKLGLSPETIGVVTYFFSNKVEVNVFSDLFAFVLFHFFVNYTPKKCFKGKKVAFFRALCAIPVIFVLVSFALKIGSTVGSLELSFYIYPFLTTKSPLVFCVFVLASLWIKNREKLFLSFGATREEYKAFLLTKRNSLSFSLQLSKIILVFSILDLFLGIVFVIIMAIAGMPVDQGIQAMGVFGLGQCVPLLIAIPFILLYSYTRTHKNGNIDVLLPIIGIGLIVLTYIEAVYQFLTMMAGGA